MMNAGYIAENCSLSVAGDSQIEVASLRYAKDATETDIAVAFSEKEITETKARVVLCEPCMCLTEKTVLFCIYGGIFPALNRVVNFFVENGYLPDYNAPPTYVQYENGVYSGIGLKVGMGTHIAPFVTIGDNVKIGDNCRIESNVFIGSGTEIGDGCIIHSGSRVGADSFLHYEENGEAVCFSGVGRTVLRDGVQIGYNAVVQRGTLSDTVLNSRVLIGNLVVVAHDVTIGSDSRIVCQSGIAGGAKIGSHVKILGQSGVVDGVCIEDFATLLSKSVATKAISRGKKVSGLYGREHRDELKIQAKLRKLKGE